MTEDDAILLAALLLAAIDMIRGRPAESLDTEVYRQRATVLVRKLKEKKS